MFAPFLQTALLMIKVPVAQCDVNNLMDGLQLVEKISEAFYLFVECPKGLPTGGWYGQAGSSSCVGSGRQPGPVLLV